MREEKKMPLVECPSCGKAAVPPEYVCRKCGQTELRDIAVAGNGTIYTFTTIRIAPEAYRDQAPYDIAVVELDPELRVTARIVPGGSEAPLTIGQAVTFDHVDEAGYWFAPA